MIDTGAGPSLLKISKKPSKAIVIENEILGLRGITKESINSCDKVPLLFRDLTLYFHLVPDHFPIEEDGLIGSEVLRRYGAKINYEENILHIASHVIVLRCTGSVNIIKTTNKESIKLAGVERRKASAVVGKLSNSLVSCDIATQHERVDINKCSLTSIINSPTQYTVTTIAKRIVRKWEIKII